MKIWFDADNGPHVLIIKPLIAELLRRGHEVQVTARDRTRTCELLDLYGIAHRTIGGAYGSGMWNKVRGTLGRSLHLASAMRGQGCAVSFGHGSRALPLASRLLSIPSVTMYDYEWVDARVFRRFCRTILLPEAIDAGRCAEVGLPERLVTRYPGFKEELYLGDRPLDPAAVAADLGLRPDAVKVLLRPPATDAHYHNPEAETILAAILERLSGREDLDLVYFARDPAQMAWLEPYALPRIVVPQKVYDGPSLIAAMDLVIGGGGTMTREAAVLGVPACSFFRGRTGRVDERLSREGRLLLLERPQDAAGPRVERRTGPIAAPDNTGLVEFICDRIVAAARPSPGSLRQNALLP